MPDGPWSGAVQATAAGGIGWSWPLPTRGDTGNFVLGVNFGIQFVLPLLHHGPQEAK